ncbi:uncharacterized protein PG986_012764 [Apiospora aurea]|uniref:Uncharacterized protein n=1 Tax=Apiospora aurea TaxID=335848 RepID=A0ABR1Q0W9_9PEZI
MSPSSTRRSARLHGPVPNSRPKTSTHSAADSYAIASSSDDKDDENDDNEFIPATISPHKVVAGANGPSLRPSRPFKRHPEDATIDHNPSAKRPRNNGIASSPLRRRSQPEARKDTGLASPAPSRAITAPNKRASLRVRGESSSDNEVDLALFELVNSKMLKRKPVEAPPSPSQQLQQEARQEPEQEEPEPEQEDFDMEDPQQENSEQHEPELDDSEQDELASGSAPINAAYAEDNAYSNIDIDGDKDLSAEAMPWVGSDDIEGLDQSGSKEDALEPDDERSVQQNEPENDSHYYDSLGEGDSSTNQDNNDATAISGIQHGHYDPYELPESPVRGHHGGSVPNAEQSRRDADILEAQLVGDVGRSNSQGSGQDDTEDMDIDSDVDFEVESNLDIEYGDMSPRECLAQDVERFCSRAGDFNDSLLFEPPESPSSTTIFLSSKNLETLRKIINRKGWVGRAKAADGTFLDWETKLHNDWERRLRGGSESVTAVGKVLFHFTEKMERLIRSALIAPSQEKRNRVYREHADFLKYCFSMLHNCITFIQDQRLSFSKMQSFLSKCKEKREEMTEEIASLHIPTIFRLLTRIWGPCGKNERRSSFDSFSIQLLARVAGWIEQLYRPFIRELRAMEDSAPWKNIREEFETPMKQLRQQLADAPELLEQEEESQALQKADRQKDLLRQKELELQRQQDGDEKVEARRRRNQEVVQFIRQEQGRRFEGRRSLNEDVPSHQEEQHRERAVSQQVQSSPAAIGVEETVWRGEEEHVLCEKLIASFSTPNPRLPSLHNTATVVGHTREETVDKARELLHAIVSRGSKGSLSGEEVHNRVQAIMRQWE